MSIDPIQIPTPKPSDTAWPDFPPRGLAIATPANLTSSAFIRVDSFSVAKLPNNVAIVAVASQDASLLSLPLSSDASELANRESSRIFLITTALSSALSTPVLCAKVWQRPSHVYCENLVFSPTSSIDIQVPPAIWANQSYTHIWPITGDFAGRPCVIESRPSSNIWRINCLSGSVLVSVDLDFSFVAYGDTAPSVPSVAGITPLPYIMHDGLAVAATNPQIISNANIVPTPSQPTVYVVAEAPVDGAYQLFLYSQTIGGDGYGWKQLTFDGENRNARVSMDTDSNLHVAWETVRCPITDYHYGTLTFAAIGDYGTGDLTENSVAQLVKSRQPNIIITLGDNNYPLGDESTIDSRVGQYYSDFIGNYEGTYGVGATENRFFPSMGNHDWGNVVPTTNYGQGYFDYFTLPGNERYYRFVRGPVEFFVLDSDQNEPDGYTSMSAQAKWLKNALADSTAQWKIVYFHHSPYSSGSVHGSTTYMRWPFDVWGVDAVLSGHEHSYERLLVGGIPYIVAGTAGAGLYPFSSPISGSQVRYSGSNGAVFATATPTSLTFSFIDVNNTVIDSTMLTKAAPSPSTTKEYAGIMYGIVGPSSAGLANEVLISAIDKQSQLILDTANPLPDESRNKSTLPISYQEPILDITTPIALNLRDVDSYGGPVGSDELWITAIEGGSVSVVDDATINASGNPHTSRFSSFVCLNRDESSNPFGPDFTQFHYQLSFNLNLTSASVTNRSDADVDTLYKSWKAQFEAVPWSLAPKYLEIGTNPYWLNGNIYTINEPDRLYGNMIPVAGSYKYPPICQDGSTASSPGDLRHFVLGIIPEKIRFRATNVETQAEFTVANPIYPGSSGTSGATYTQYIEQEYYTGNFKLALLLETSADLSNLSLETKKKHAVRMFGGTFRFGTANNFKVAVSYTRLRDEQVKMRKQVDLIGGLEQNVRFSGGIIVAVNNVVQGADNFVTDFSDNYWSFDIGLGCPTIGEFRIGNPVPYDANKWLDLSVSMAFTNVAIGPHSMTLNPYIGWMAPADRDTSKMMSLSSLPDAFTSQTAASAAALDSATYALTLGTNRTGFSLNQIPITFEGTNTSPSIVVDGCDKTHIAYQSNRDNQWEIYYTGSLDQGHPFRYDTRITRVPSRSLAPTIAVDERGHRLIVWHDDRDGNFQIYAARSTNEHTCRVCDNDAQWIEYTDNFGFDPYAASNPFFPFDPNNPLDHWDGADPYDPYDPYFAGICELGFTYTNETGSGNFFHFRLSFYRDDLLNNFYRSINSSQDISNWAVGGNQMGYEGAFLSNGQSLNLAYDVSGDDDLTGQVFHVVIESYDGTTYRRLPEVAIFYCPPSQTSRCTLPCSYTNTSGSTQGVHFTVTVYKDAAMTSAVMTASSSSDQTGWVSGNGRLPSGGLSVPNTATISAYYDPTFLSPEQYATQNDQNVQSLLCNVKYWVQVAVNIGVSTTNLQSYAVFCDCKSTDSYTWGKDTQSNDWICSGQGFDDRRITATSSHALFPYAAGSNDGMIYVAWEDQRFNDKSQSPQIAPTVFYGAWDAAADRFYSSGQGYYDRRFIQDTNIYLKPKLLLNNFQQPAIFAQSSTNVAAIVESLAPPLPTLPTTLSGDQGVFNTTSLSLLASDLKCFAVSVAPKYEVRKYHADTDTPVSLVSDCLIDLEIHGPSGAMAVRLQNEGDSHWSDWLQILPNLPSAPPLNSSIERGDGSLRNRFSSYFISNDRFVVPWVLSAGNGTKTVSVQILTHQGVTPTFAQEILASYNALDYKVEFFSTSDYLTPLPIYNGYPVASAKRLATPDHATSAPIIQKNDVSTIANAITDVADIYVRVTFNDPEQLSQKVGLKNVDRFADLGPVTFDVIQQGTMRQGGLLLAPDGDTYANGVPVNGVYKGMFPVVESDGFRTKDGLGVIVVHVPTPCKNANPLVIEDCDNPTLLTPNDLRAQQKMDADARVITLERFRYQYNQDLLCSFTTNECVDGEQPPVFDDVSEVPIYAGPPACQIDDWIAPKAAEPNFRKDGSNLSVYFRESPVYTLDWSDTRITKLVLGSNTEIEGLVFIVPGNQSVSAVSGQNGAITYTLPAGTITLGPTTGAYRYPPTASTIGTSAKTFGSFQLAAGDNTVPVGGSGGISNVPAGLNPVSVSAGTATNLSRSILSGMLVGSQLVFKFIAVATGYGRACIRDVVCGSTCTTVPLPPVNLNAAVTADFEIDLTWEAPPQGADGYTIEISVDNGEYQTYAIAGGNKYTVNTGLLADTPYCFRMTAYNGCGSSDYSNTSCVVTGCISPHAITGFSALVISDTQVNLSWSLTPGITQYVIERRPQSGKFFATISPVLSQNTTSYSDTTAVAGTPYYYIVVGSNLCGSRSSGTLSVTTTCTFPSQVATVNVTAINGTTSQITWSSAARATAYYLDRSIDEGATFNQLAIINAPTLLYTDNGLSVGINYCYRIRAFNSCGVAAASSIGCEQGLNCGTMGSTFTWSVARQTEPYYVNTGGVNSPTYNPPSVAWIHESGSDSLSLADHRITRITFGATASLDDILILMPSGTHVTQTWDSTPLDPLTFTIPHNSIIFANNFGYYVNSDGPGYNHSPQKTFNESGTSHTLTLPAGTVSNNGTGNIQDFINAGFYCVDFSGGISRDILNSKGYIDGNGLFTFNFAHILCGIGHLLNFSLTCDTGCPGTNTAPTCTAKNTPTLLTGSPSGTALTLNWHDTNSGTAAYLIERQEDGGSWQTTDITSVGATTYTDNVISGHTFCYRVRVQDCTYLTGVCGIDLYIEDNPLVTDCGNAHVQVTGIGLQFAIVAGTIQLYASQSGPITVTLVSDGTGTCMHHFTPQVNSVTHTWANGASTIDDTRLNGNVPQTNSINLVASDRLQLLMTMSGSGTCVAGTHDDQTGRATWTITNCEQHNTVATPPSNVVCLEAGCPTTCHDCCQTYVLTVTGASANNGTYTLYNAGTCNYSDGSEFNIIRKNGGLWVLTIGNGSCQMEWTTPCNGCPPNDSSQWILSVSNTTCTGTPHLAISSFDCNLASSSSTADPCNIADNANGGNEGYDKTFDLSGAFSIASTVRFVFTYNTYIIPDHMIVTTSSGQVLVDTGCVGTNGEVSTYFDVTLADSPIRIRTIANCNGSTDSGWYWRMHCTSIACTPTVPLAPIGSLLTPIASCSSDSNVLLWEEYQVSPTTCNCGSGNSTDSIGDLIYQGGCSWQSADTPPWQLSFDNVNTWTLTRGTSPVLWTGTKTGTDPIGTYTRTAGADPITTRTVSVECQTCPNDCSECCHNIEVVISNASSHLNGVWTLARNLNEPFWSTGFSGGSKPANATSSVQMCIKCDGFNWILITVNDNSSNMTWTAPLSPCPPLISTAWTEIAGPADTNITFECLDCILDCTSCPSYSLHTIGFSTCTDFDGTFALIKSGCGWSGTGPYGIAVTLICASGIWTLKIAASPSRYAIATQPGAASCPPTGTWNFTTVGCGGEVGTGTVS